LTLATFPIPPLSLLLEERDPLPNSYSWFSRPRPEPELGPKALATDIITFSEEQGEAELEYARKAEPAAQTQKSHRHADPNAKGRALLAAMFGPRSVRVG